MQGENESRKLEIHGLKDILVRENEKLGKMYPDKILFVAKLFAKIFVSPEAFRENMCKTGGNARGNLNNFLFLP